MWKLYEDTKLCGLETIEFTSYEVAMYNEDLLKKEMRMEPHLEHGSQPP
jgi:hypothetical protein